MSASLEEASESAEDWQALDNEEQDELLSEELERQSGRSPSAGQARAQQQPQTQAGAPAPDVAASNAAGFRELMQETWSKVVNGVEVEFDTLDEETTKEVMNEAFALFNLADEADELDVEDPHANPEEAVGEFDDELVDMLLGGNEEFDAWLNETLGRVCADDTMDEEWWADGQNRPGGTKLSTFITVMEKAVAAYEEIDQFRLQ